MLSQVAHHQTLRRICVDINEIGQHTVGSEYNQSHDEPIRVAWTSAWQNRVADDSYESSQEYMGSYSVQP